MSSRCTDRTSRRRGFGVPTFLALLIPAVVKVGALALSYQSSTARRMTSSVWTTYVALELAESAIAEAAHFLKPEHVLPKEVVDQVPTTGDFPTELLRKMVSDDDPDPARKFDASRLSGVAAFEYRAIRAGSTVKKKMLVALHFLPSVPPKRVIGKDAGPTCAQKIAQENTGVCLDRKDVDLVVYARPLTYRREYYTHPLSPYQGASPSSSPPPPPPPPPPGSSTAGGSSGYWVHWGVVQLTVRVRVNDIKGITTHELKVDRRFTFIPNVPPGQEFLRVSSLNLKTASSVVD